MKYLSHLFLIVSLGSLSRVSATSLSETNKGIYIAIAGWGIQPSRGFVGDETIQFDDRLLWKPFGNTGALELNYPDRTYGVRVKMHRPDGREIVKTKLGDTLGSKFDRVQSYDDVAHGWSMGGVTAAGPYDPRGEGFTSPPLPAPKDLFQMEHAGAYTMEVEMLLFRVLKKIGRAHVCTPV